MLWRGFQKPKRLAVDQESLTNNVRQVFRRSPLSAASAPPSAMRCAAPCSSSIEGAAVNGRAHRGRAARVPVDLGRR